MHFYLKITFLFFYLFSFSQDMRDKAHLLETSASLDKLIAASENKKLVLLGEASHGTLEYYTWRDSISRRLIQEHAFSFIAVEGDFASLYELNRYVKNKEGAAKSARKVLLKLNRWPLWMWANEEIVAFAEWLRKYNDTLPENQKVGFYGMDVYDEWHSKNAILDLLKKHDKTLYNLVKEYYNCFSPYKGNSWSYATAVKNGKKSCEESTARVLDLLIQNRENLEISKDDYFYLLQNALVVHNAEKFYRKEVLYKDASSWNSRVYHMNQTIHNLLFQYGEGAKGIVWAHNTHIGDALYSSMGNSNQKNIGQLTREYFGKENVFLIGFTTYRGSVMAAKSWGAPMQKMLIPAAIKNSAEQLMFKTGLHSFYLIFDDDDRANKNLKKEIGNRAVGVVYNPEGDHRQFVQTILPMRYDAKIFIRDTKALQPLHK